MTVRFHVFLPPTLSPRDGSGITETESRLIFHDLPRPSRGAAASQSLAQRHTGRSIQLLRHSATKPSEDETFGSASSRRGDVDLEVGKPENPIEDPLAAAEPHLGKRSREAVQPDVPDVTRGTAASMALRALGPRRSSRFARASDGFLTALPGPGLDTTESFLSLNTTATISQLSQPPLPNWSIPLSKLVSLHSLLAMGSARSTRRAPQHSDKLNLMVCVMAVDTPVRRQRKEERARGQEGTLWIGGWKVTTPPEGEQGNVGGSDGNGEAGCSVKLWEGMAREWGDATVRRGDVVLLEYVEFKAATAKDPASLVISPSSSGTQPKVTILYRTLPRRVTRKSDYLPPRSARSKARDILPYIQDAAISPEDAALRPDLTLGRSDAGVRRVAEWARWFADWVGGEPP